MINYHGVNASSLIRNEARQEYMGDGLAKEMYIVSTRRTIPNKELIILDISGTWKL